MQKAYINSLYSLMKKDKNVISCLSDSGTDYDEMIARELPNQCVNFGISENNKVAAAAGLASCGKIPFVYTTSSFLAYRSYEFIRDDVCLQNRNVKLVGMGSGISWSTLGPTHHATEDISVLKAIPNLTILSPASPKELEKCIEYAYEKKGPVYIRMGMGHEREIYDECNFKISTNSLISDGNGLTIFTTGSIISEVLDAKELLLKDGINARIINISTIKPLDITGIVEECKDQKNIVTIEEHNIIGGIGSSVADVIAEYGLDCNLNKIGLNDCFAAGYGTYDEIRKMNKLDSESIYIKIKNYLTKNNVQI